MVNYIKLLMRVLSQPMSWSDVKELYEEDGRSVDFAIPKDLRNELDEWHMQGKFVFVYQDKAQFPIDIMHLVVEKLIKVYRKNPQQLLTDVMEWLFRYRPDIYVMKALVQIESSVKVKEIYVHHDKEKCVKMAPQLYEHNSNIIGLMLVRLKGGQVLNSVCVWTDKGWLEEGQPEEPTEV